MVFFSAKFLYFLTRFLATSCVAIVPLVFFKFITSPTGSVGRLLLFSLLLFFVTLKMYCIESWSLMSRYAAAFNQLAEVLFFYLVVLLIFFYCCCFLYFSFTLLAAFTTLFNRVDIHFLLFWGLLSIKTY